VRNGGLRLLKREAVFFTQGEQNLSLYRSSKNMNRRGEEAVLM
jgi:hypothetical protein